MKIRLIYKVGEVWKDTDSYYKTKQWGVQFPTGRLYFKTKSEALKWASTIKQEVEK